MCQWHVRIIECTYVHMCIYVTSNAASLHSALCVMQLIVVLHEVGAAVNIGHTRDHLCLQWPLMYENDIKKRGIHADVHMWSKWPIALNEHLQNLSLASLAV